MQLTAEISCRSTCAECPAGPKTEQQDGCAGHAVSEFQQGSADTLGSETGRPFVPEIVGADQQHHRLRPRAIQMAVLQPPQMVDAVATDTGVQHARGPRYGYWAS